MHELKSSLERPEIRSPWGERETAEENPFSGAPWHPNFGHLNILPANMKREFSRDGPLVHYPVPSGHA